VRHLSAPAPPSPRFSLIEGALFFPATLFVQKTLFFPATLFVQKTLFLPAALFVQKMLFLPAALFLLQKTVAFPVPFWLAIPKGHVRPQRLKNLT